MLQRRCFVCVLVAAVTLQGPTDLPESESAVSCQSRQGRLASPGGNLDASNSLGLTVNKPQPQIDTSHGLGNNCGANGSG